jgi:hypothetical protein
MRASSTVAAVAVALTLTTGCARSGTGGDASPPAERTTGGTMNSPALSAPGPTVTLQGTVSMGVEPGCIILDADDGQSYLLLDGDREIIMSGGRIEVEAVLEPDIMTTCQQGTPVTVLSVRRL